MEDVQKKDLSIYKSNTKRKKILILAAAYMVNCPRAVAMVEILKDTYELSVLGLENPSSSAKNEEILGVKNYFYPQYKKRNTLQELRLWLDVMFSRWERLSFTHNRLAIIEHLRLHRYDVVICHDLLLLPVLFAGLSLDNGQSRMHTKVLFDAREFYPWQNTSSLRWRLLFKRFNAYLCATYAPKADTMISVSPNFCALYKKHFGLQSQLVMSLPNFYELKPSMVHSERIKILYHGALNQNRGIDELLEFCLLLDERFCVDFIFTGGEASYRAQIESTLHSLQAKGARIRQLEPVSLECIIPFGNAYDIGLIYVPLHNHNLLATLPNKFFEYIQSRLALLLPPIESMLSITREYNNAIVAEDFSMHSLAHALNTLGHEEIMAYKYASHKAAKKLHRAYNIPIVQGIIQELVE